MLFSPFKFVSSSSVFQDGHSPFLSSEENVETKGESRGLGSSLAPVQEPAPTEEPGVGSHAQASLSERAGALPEPVPVAQVWWPVPGRVGAEVTCTEPVPRAA